MWNFLIHKEVLDFPIGKKLFLSDLSPLELVVKKFQLK